MVAGVTIGHAGCKGEAQPLRPVIRPISFATIASTIGGRFLSSHSASIGRSIARTMPSSEVSPTPWSGSGAWGSGSRS